MTNSNSTNKMRRVKCLTTLISFVLLLVPDLRAQQSTTSITIPYRGDQNGWLWGGELHLVLHASRDDNGCMRYTFEYNTHNLISAWADKMVTVDTQPYSFTVCDDNQCSISVPLWGTMRVWMQDQPVWNNYFIMNVSWNRCTNQWIWDDFAMWKSAGSTQTLPATLILKQNFPNPFNPATTIGYDLPEDSYVRLRVFDIHGRFLSELVNEEKAAGSYSVEFDGSRIPSGRYYYRLEAGSVVRTNVMTLVK